MQGYMEKGIKGQIQGYSETRKHRENVTGYRKMNSRNTGK